MGCDIHCFVEKKDLKTKDWKQITGFKSDFYRPDSEHFSSDNYKNGPSLLDCRNYDEFAILADVRNGRGFAGCDTGDTITPISMPKGIPNDVSNEIKKESDDWGGDGHSHSWLTAQEINDYNAHEIKKVHRAYVTSTVYRKFKETGDPYPNCGGVSGQNVIFSPNEACEEVKEMNPEKSVYTQIEWETTAFESAEWLFTEGMEQLIKRSETGKGDDVRLVFWFDN